MYSEQMMREQGFDDAPNFRLNMHTDAIWRACRIILDVRMHRGEIGVDEAIRFMVEHTSFEESNARAEVLRYTYTPTYQLSYLLGKVLLLQLRADERRRLGSRVLAQGLPRHAAAQRQPADQLPPPAAARAIAAGAPSAVGRASTARPLADASAACRSSRRSTSRAVARASSSGPARRPASARRPIGPSGSRSGSSSRARGSSTSSTSTAPGPASPRNLEAIGSVAARVAVPLQVAGGLEGADAIRLAFAAGATRVVLGLSVVDDPTLLARLPRGRRRLAGGRPRSRGPTGWPPSRGAGRHGPTLEIARRRARRRAGSAGSSCGHGGSEPGPRRCSPASSRRTMPRSSSPAASPTSTAISRTPRRRRRGLILGESLLSGADRLPRRPGGRRMTPLRRLAPTRSIPVAATLALIAVVAARLRRLPVAPRRRRRPPAPRPAVGRPRPRAPTALPDEPARRRCPPARSGR